MINVKRFVSDLIASNCYVLYNTESKKAIVIDPGIIEFAEFANFIKVKGLNISYIFLTHSHFDHMAGVKHIKEEYSSKIICSEECANKITDSKKNLSIFSNFGEYSAPKGDVFVEDNYELNWEGMKITCYNTKGHSSCSICIYVDGMLFTGDTLLKGIRSTVVKPSGNRKVLQSSINFIYNKFKSNTVIYPGHGENFILEDQNIEIAL